MNLNLPTETLWAEDEHGNKWIPEEGQDITEAPEGYDYINIIDTNTVSHLIYCRDREEKELRELVNMRSTWHSHVMLGLWVKEGIAIGRAIRIAAEACERCMNALAHKYGVGWGYPEDSQEYRDCETRCKLCREEDR